jgi:hypothetical protein
MVESPNPALWASVAWFISNSARAARDWAGVKGSTFIVDMAGAIEYQQLLLIDASGVPTWLPLGMT